MKTLKTLAVTAIAVLGVVLTGVAVQAQAVRGGETVTVPASEHINGALYAAGNVVTIDSDIDGDVYCAGQTVTINATVHGDVLCAGQTVTIKGKIDGDVRAAGQVVIMDAAVDGSATIGAQTFTQSSDSTVTRDIVVGATDVALQGTIGRDATIGAENAVVSGKIGRDVSAEVTGLRLASNASIGGSITYASYNDVTQADGVHVGGKVTKTQPAEANVPEQKVTIADVLGWYFYCFIALLIIALAFALLSPNMLRVATDRAFPQPWWALLAGFVAGIAVPVVFIMLLLTFVGIPLAIVTLLLWGAVLLVSGPVFSYYIGRLIMPRTTHPVLIMLVGASIVIVASFVPVLNVLTFLAVTWFGSGMVILEAFRRMPERKSKGKK
jgi:cytoskeletal protein CcmA (bactofilin family)